MPVTSLDTGEAASGHLALAVADINWFTTESLFQEIDRQSVSILALRCMDYVNGWRKGIYPWSSSCRPRPWGNNCLTRDLVLPSGWMKSYPRLGMRPIAKAIQGFWNQRDPRARRGLVLTYPHYLYLRDQLRPDVTLYYNIDDYALYWPRHAAQVRCLERQMVLRADATICVARVSGRYALRSRSGSGREDPSSPSRHAGGVPGGRALSSTRVGSRRHRPPA